MRKLLVLALFAASVTAFAALTPVTADDKKDDKEIKPEIEVVYVPTHEKVVSAMLKLADVKENDTVYDLGCGDGRITIAAVKEFKAKRGLGLDFNPERLKDCIVSAAKADLPAKQKASLQLGYDGNRLASINYEADGQTVLTFKRGDVLKMTPEDFKDVDVVTLYLYPQVNVRLMPVLKKGLKVGARIVSHDFDMGDWKEDKQEKVEADRTHTIYLWTIKKEDKEEKK